MLARVKGAHGLPFALGLSCLVAGVAMPGLERVARADEHEEEPRLRTARIVDRTRDETNPFHGSALFFEQSMTTQTADVGMTPQSYVPLYELWLSLRPRYWFDNHWSVRARFDYTKELTNNQTTTLYRQDVLGDTWTDAVYSAKLDGIWKKGSTADVGLRVIWPTSLASEAEGIYFRTGPRAGIGHDFELRSEDSYWLQSAHVGLAGAYLRTVASATTPTSYAGFAYTRENAEGVSFLSDQISGATLIRDELQLVLEGDLSITPRLGFKTFFAFFNQWHDLPATTTPIATGTGGYAVPYSGDVQVTQMLWFLVDFDYQLIDELALSVGYYNLTNAVAQDGQSRTLFGSDNIWWSPDARFSFTVTANLDVLYDDATRHHRPAPQAAAR
jgi:hypothetical protein